MARPALSTKKKVDDDAGRIDPVSPTLTEDNEDVDDETKGPLLSYSVDIQPNDDTPRTTAL